MRSPLVVMPALWLMQGQLNNQSLDFLGSLDFEEADGEYKGTSGLECENESYSSCQGEKSQKNILIPLGQDTFPMKKSISSLACSCERD